MHPNQFLTHTLRAHPHGEHITHILAAAINAVDPEQAVIRHLKREGEFLQAGGRSCDLNQIERIFVVGAGKAGLPMAQGVQQVLGERITTGQVIVKDGHSEGLEIVGNIRIVEAAHPLPDERGVRSTQEILKLLSSTTSNDLVICLISGGGSALLTAPAAGVSLEDLRTLTDALLACGAKINEINTLRKQLDQVKGGGLARAASPAQVLTLILSDVVGDPLGMIASGPTVPNPHTPKDALAVLEKYDLLSKVPASIPNALSNAPRILDDLDNVFNLLVGNNEIAARAALDQAASFGFHTQLLTTTLQGEASLVGRDLAERLRKLAEDKNTPRPTLLVAGGETTVTLQGDGAGGRNQELALAAVNTLAGLENVVLVALATDGGDGPTDAAGAVVTGGTLARADEISLDTAQYLANNDSYTYFSELGDFLMPGPTRTNVNDLVLLFVF